jgi:Phycobilisome protein
VNLAAAERLSLAERRVALRATDLVYERRPELERLGAVARHRCEEDTALHVKFVTSAVALGDPAILADYVAWLAPLLERFGVPEEDLDASLEAIRSAVEELVPEDAGLVSALLAEVRGAG